MAGRNGARTLYSWRLAGAAALLVAGLLLASGARGQFWFGARPMPEFANRSAAAWINSAPLAKADLTGKVVLIEIWTSI